MGYHRAGFEVVGVDTKPQPNYPFKFWQYDAMGFMLMQDIGHSFDAIHASPPCQAYLNLGSVNRALGRTYDHRAIVGRVREQLESTGLPYVIENVPDAEPYLRNPIQLCGSSFGLDVRRHRLFECSFPVMAAPCAHALQNEPKFWTGWRPEGEKRKATVVQVYGNGAERDKWGPAMGIDWMRPDELTQAIPPAYTEHIGFYLKARINR